MNISTSGRIRGDVRTMTITLTGDDRDFVNLIDEGAELDGDLGVLIAKIASSTGLVADRGDASANAARLLRRAAELLDRASVDSNA